VTFDAPGVVTNPIESPDHVAPPCSSGSPKGFTLAELAVVIVIIGVLAAFGVPRFLKSVERSKACEALAYFSAVWSSQERYLAHYNQYSTDISLLEIQYPSPAYVSVETVSMG
jgi:prepilin-type N-terminal cleavage/methylation domain-containing protein